MQNLQQSAQNPDYYPPKPRAAAGNRHPAQLVPGEPAAIRTGGSCSRPKTGRGAADTPQKSGRGQQIPGAARAGFPSLQVDRGRSGRQLVPGAIRNQGGTGSDPGRADAGTPAQLVPGTGTRNSYSRTQPRARSGRPRSWYPLQLIPGTRHPARSGQNETPQRRGYQDRKKGRADNGKADGQESRNRVNKRELETVLSG